MLDWLRPRLLGPGTSLLKVIARGPAQEVFGKYALIPEAIREAMDALFVEVGEEPPNSYSLDGDLHPALLLHWRVQANLVGHLSPAEVSWSVVEVQGERPAHLDIHHKQRAAPPGPQGGCGRMNS